MKLKNSFALILILLMVFTLPACKTLKMTPMLKAADQGQFDAVNQLLAAGVEVNAATEEGVTPLFIASLKGHEEVVRGLISRGADVNAAVKQTFKFEGQTIYEGRTSLLAALSHNHSDIAKILIEDGADVNAGDSNGVTPLFIAAGLNDQGLVKILIEKGADVNAVTLKEYEYEGQPVIKGATPLMAALKMEQKDSAFLLMNSGADVNVRCEDGTDALVIAALNSDAAMVNFLLAHGANHQTRATKDSMVKGELVFEGVTTLMIAAGVGNMDSVVALIDAGSDVNAVSKKGATALMAAAAQGHRDIAELLIASGAKVNARTIEPFNIGKRAIHKGISPLGEAASAGHADVVRCLIENGADVSARDDFDMDALFYAADNGHLEVVKILIENNADIYGIHAGRTALVAAQHNGHDDIADLILDARMKVEERSKK
jgi:ankyrin repeat protein